MNGRKRHIVVDTLGGVLNYANQTKEAVN
ncbi:hypothetical protein [Endozoicomonas montiporae]